MSDCGCAEYNVKQSIKTVKTSGCGHPSEKQQSSVNDETGGSSMEGLIKVKIEKVFIAP